MNVEAVDAEASRWMRQGITLLSNGGLPELDEAVAAFDRAIALRRQIVDSGRPEYGFGLGTGWLNRGEALARKGDPSSLTEALAAFDRGIDLLAALPWQTDAEIRRRLAVGWQNRGLALHAIGDRFDEAKRSYGEALRLVSTAVAHEIAGRDAILAAINTSLASLLVEVPGVESARAAESAAALALSSIDSSAAETDVTVAEIAIKARYILCRATAAELTLTKTGDSPPEETLHLVTDAVDEGLALAGRWEKKGVSRFRGLAVDLLRFGSRVYARHQPQFLEEFVKESLDPLQSSSAFAASSEVRVARLEALWLSFSRGSKAR